MSVSVDLLENPVYTRRPCLITAYQILQITPIFEFFKPVFAYEMPNSRTSKGVYRCLSNPIFTYDEYKFISNVNTPTLAYLSFAYACAATLTYWSWTAAYRSSNPADSAFQP